MTHRYSETSQRIQQTGFMEMQHPKEMKTPPKEPKIIKYSGGVTSASGEKGGLVFSRPNLIKKYQKLFQSGDAPVFLKKGRSDQLIYQGLMVGSLVGLTLGMAGLYKMAMPKKN
eukprot:gene20413-22426_t